MSIRMHTLNYSYQLFSLTNQNNQKNHSSDKKIE